MDRSFLGLLFSIVIHGLILWLLLTMKLPAVVPHETPTEITLIEKDNKKSQTFVTETTKKEDVFDKLKDQADYLSQFNKRVKKQMKARDSGPTVNRTQNLNLKPTEQVTENAGKKSQAPKGDGPGLLSPNGGAQLRQVAIGASSISENIPGVEEGAFTALNSDQFTYYAFFARINEQVRNRWVSMIRNYMSSLSQDELAHLAKINRETIVEIILNRSGEYVRSTVHSSSKVNDLDRAAFESFRRAAPFVNPPQGLVENDGFIHLQYAFVVTFRPTFGPGTY